MTQEIVRALVDGVWVTEVASQSGGGGGLPTGWTQDASDPATLSANGGGLDMGGGSITNAGLDAAGGDVQGVGNLTGFSGDLLIKDDAFSPTASLELGSSKMVGSLGGHGFEIHAGAGDPTGSGGVAAPGGSLYVQTGGIGARALWVKTGSLDTEWQQLAFVA